MLEWRSQFNELSSSTYTYAKLSRPDFGLFRLFGPGLGNLLFPWARSIVAARRNGLTPLFPTWFQLKIGPLLRGERDSRLYGDLFSRPDDYAELSTKMSVLTAAEYLGPKSIPIDEDQTASWRPKVLLFRGMQEYFRPIRDNWELVRRELLKMTKSHHLTGWRELSGENICIHVRMGDFSEPESEEEIISGGRNYRLPLSWYREKAAQIRASLSRPIPICVISDGDDDELAPLLELPNAERRFYGSSIADMLALAKGGVLIASGSTFSMWASYLGRMPTIWFPSQMRQQLYPSNPSREIESGTDEKLPKSFVAEVQKTLNRDSHTEFR